MNRSFVSEKSSAGRDRAQQWRRSLWIAGGLALFLGVAQPLFAWYYFTTAAGERQRWVFGTSCNAATQITPIFDTDIPTQPRATVIPAILTEWNNAANVSLYASAQYTVSMNASNANAFINSPTSGELWVVWDTDGSVLRSLGVDPSGTILGVGLPLTPNPAAPADVCAAILILNASTSFLPTSAATCTTAGTCQTFAFTLLHEMGHTLGFAHAVSGRNGSAFSTAISNLPVMYPFAHSTNTLAPDDIAGARAVYGFN
ncbi:MAG: hypothetical protein NXI24_17345 [bacterium]|nr:hypothetical protein [bacterium]